jgi:hypothetical protein
MGMAADAWLPTVISLGRAFESAISSASVFHFDSLRTTRIGVSDSTRATGSKAR